MKTLILATAIKLLSPLFILFSIYILFRGHNNPGGGFIGGLVASIGFVFHTMTHGARSTKKLFLLVPFYMIIGKKEARYFRFIWIFWGTMLYVARISPKRMTLSRRILHIDPIYIIATGLLVAGGSGLLAVFNSDPYLTAIWTTLNVPILGKLGTPIMFDMGVYLLVVGIMFKITLIMSEE